MSPRCKDCEVQITKRVTFSSEMYKSNKQIIRCGSCYLKNRRTFRFRRTVKALVATIGEDLVSACILEDLE